MIWMVVIIISLTVFFAGILVIVMQMSGRRKKGSGHVNIGSEHVVIKGGVDTKDYHYGEKAGDLFKAGNSMYGTVVSKNGAVHHMWNACFTFIGSGRREIVVFRNKMAIGRKREYMKHMPYVEIPLDLRISSIHCYLVGKGSGLVIQDAHSLNHTYVNGRRVEKEAPLPNGSVIRVGKTEIQVTYEYR